MANQKKPRPDWWPKWFDGTRIGEEMFCREFLRSNKLLYANRAFFTVNGLLVDDTPLRDAILKKIRTFAMTGITKKIQSIIDLLKIMAYVDDFPPEEDRIHFLNGTLFLDGHFEPGKDKIVRARIPINYDPEAPQPRRWLKFLEELLEPEDILTLQEYLGYCLIPTNKAQRMMMVKGGGGEGKSQIGAIIKKLLGFLCKDGSIAKITENRFARADLENILLMVDDDMSMDKLKHTNYLKSMTTAKGKVDLELKGKQSYQGYMYTRLLAFSNGDLQSLYDRSNGFYRRQLILTTKPRDPNRVDDPDLADKMCEELPGILLWMLDGLFRLSRNDFRFTESAKAKASKEAQKQDGNNVLLFMQADDYVKYGEDGEASSQELYAVYCLWCNENGYPPLKQRSVSDYLVANARDYGLEYVNTVHNLDGRRVRGFKGIKLKADTGLRSRLGYQRAWPDDNPFE